MRKLRMKKCKQKTTVYEIKNKVRKKHHHIPVYVDISNNDIGAQG